MKRYMNYITALPDFIAMQRVSFCWFITQGLNEELSNFARMRDFSANTQYILFGQEYTLVKPVYKITKAKKYITNYSVQLIVPLEVRNNKFNSVRYHNQFSVINLPLMTTAATFVINGCERVIVSQIIRSPGVYFEKNKSQKKRNLFKRALPIDMEKLGSFFISGQVFMPESRLFFPYPVTREINDRKVRVPNWNKKHITSYSLNSLKKIEKNSCFYFLYCFKFYRTIIKTVKYGKKVELIRIFYKWLKTKKDLNFKDISYLLLYFNLLLKFLIKYQLILTESNDSKFNLNHNLNKVRQNYDQIIKNSQNNAQIQLNYNLILTNNTLLENITEIRKF